MTLGIDWMAGAACIGTPVDMVPPDTGPLMRRAKQHCVECPVRRECLSYALARPALEGVWGGITQDERRRLQMGGRMQLCRVCVTRFVGAPGGDRCDGCSRGEVMARVEARADELRGMVLEKGMTVVAAAAALGVSKSSATAWAAENLGIKRDRMGETGRELAACGTPAARKRHSRDRRRAGLSPDLSDLDCACAQLVAASPKPAPCGTPQARRRHLEQMRRRGEHPTLDGLTCECAPSRESAEKKDSESGNEGLGMAA